MKKYVKTDYPDLNMRIRKEDEGEEEDNQMELTQKNPEHYKEIDHYPTAEYQERIEALELKGLRDGGIVEEISRFMTNTQTSTCSGF